MRVALICIDKAGTLPTRLENRVAHLEHIQSAGLAEMAGPFLDLQGQMTGSLIVLDVASMSGAEDWAAADPYAKAGLLDSVTLREWHKVVG